jgi:DNA-binding LacI/PurR family transcriptional regulator
MGTLGNGMDLVAHVPAADQPAAQNLDLLVSSGATAVFFTELADAIKLEAIARQRGIAIPNDISVVVLGSHIRAEQTGTRFTSFTIPREAMGRAATHMLARRVETDESIQQVLLACEPVEGETLAPVTNRTCAS